MLKLSSSSSNTHQFYSFVIVITGLFLFGGSPRPDVQSLAILNPASLFFCGFALITINLQHWRNAKWSLLGFALLIVFTIIYMTPLGAIFDIATQHQGSGVMVRELASGARLPHFAGVAILSSWQSMFFLFGPLAILLLAIQIDRNIIRITLLPIIIIGSASSLLGILQLISGVNSPLYFYDVTNKGSAVGFFANRNHAAVFLACLFPLLALFAAKPPTTHHGGGNTSKLAAIGIAVTLVPLILVTGSRAGMVTATVGLIGGALLYFSHASSSRGPTANRSVVLICAASVLLCLAFATIYYSRAESINRIFAESGRVNDRADFWASSLPLFWQYFPFGFGPGGFVPAFQVAEPLSLLGGAYLNRLHNDWLETALAFGVPGILLMLTGTIYYLRRSFVLWLRMDGGRSSVALGRMASVVIAILGIASISDYPLRTPAMAGFAALVLVWFGHARDRP